MNGCPLRRNGGRMGAAGTPGAGPPFRLSGATAPILP